MEFKTVLLEFREPGKEFRKYTKESFLSELPKTVELDHKVNGKKLGDVDLFIENNSIKGNIKINDDLLLKDKILFSKFKNLNLPSYSLCLKNIEEENGEIIKCEIKYVSFVNYK